MMPSFSRPLRVELNGIDVTQYVLDASLATEPANVSGEVPPLRTLRVNVSSLNELIRTLRLAVDEETESYREFVARIRRRPEDDPYRAFERLIGPDLTQGNAQPVERDTHTFAQDPAEPNARLCGNCGMWPEHHNHVRDNSFDVCVCQECMPDAMDLPDDQHQVYGDGSRHFVPDSWLLDEDAS